MPGLPREYSIPRNRPTCDLDTGSYRYQAVVCPIPRIANDQHLPRIRLLSESHRRRVFQRECPLLEDSHSLQQCGQLRWSDDEDSSSIYTGCMFRYQPSPFSPLVIPQDTLLDPCRDVRLPPAAAGQQGHGQQLSCDDSPGGWSRGTAEMADAGDS